MGTLEDYPHWAEPYYQAALRVFPLTGAGPAFTVVMCRFTTAEIHDVRAACGELLEGGTWMPAWIWVPNTEAIKEKLVHGTPQSAA